MSEATSDNVWLREHKFGLLDGAKKQSVLQGVGKKGVPQGYSLGPPMLLTCIKGILLFF